MMNKILNATVIQEPWQHILIDNILPLHIWNAVKDAATIMSSSVTDGAYSIDIIDAKEYGVPQSTVDLIVDYTDSLLDIHKEVISKFDHMSFTEYGYLSDMRWSFSKNQLEPIHDDKANLNKMMTFVIYVSPEEDTGTLIYTSPDKDTGYHSTIPWKPNSGILFCPQHNVTWHTYVSGNTPRITLNLYYHGLDRWFLNEDFQNNAILKQRLDRIKWVRTKFEENKLVRAYKGDVLEIFKIFDERLENEKNNNQ